MSERSGVEIDYCPQCRGVWLDRGELDKIIDRAADSLVSPAAAPAPPSPGLVPPPLYSPSRSDERRERPRYDEPRHEQERFGDRRRPKKKEGWLGELFDF